MEKLERNDLYHLFCTVRDVMSSHADELGKMDAMMGDGDLGLTMTKGFRALPELILACDSSDIGQTLIQAGMKMAGIVPSTMGTLMASGLMGGGKEEKPANSNLTPSIYIQADNSVPQVREVKAPPSSNVRIKFKVVLLG